MRILGSPMKIWGRQWKYEVVDESMGVVDENMGVVDESMGVVDENIGVVEK